jgi:short subunit dehydrogenase-like uncharacterized protein
MGPLVVYGAYGYTGELVARRAVERGLHPVLAGRDSERLARLGRELGCEWRAFPVSDPDALRRGIAGAGAVLNCAGPFAETARPVAEACIDERVHYLDVGGEIPVLAALLAMGPAAANAGVMLLPAAGFDVVPTDCLAAHLAARLPAATSLVLAIHGFRRMSRGSARTALGVVASSEPYRPRTAPPTRRFDLGTVAFTGAAMPWTDTFTAPRSTGISDVTVYLAAGPVFRAMLRVAPITAPLGQPLMRSRPVREALAAVMTGGERGPSAEERAAGRVTLYGEVVDAAGSRAAAIERVPEAYTVTALAAMEIAERVLRGEARPGWQTPATAYGPDLVLALPGVTREDL